jgi:hypothetical protein
VATSVVLPSVSTPSLLIESVDGKILFGEIKAQDLQMKKLIVKQKNGVEVYHRES